MKPHSPVCFSQSLKLNDTCKKLLEFCSGKVKAARFRNRLGFVSRLSEKKERARKATPEINEWVDYLATKIDVVERPTPTGPYVTIHGEKWDRYDDRYRGPDCGANFWPAEDESEQNLLNQKAVYCSDSEANHETEQN